VGIALRPDLACPLRFTTLGDAAMTCPYLKEVTMVFCRAYPVKKLVPVDRVTTASTCGADSFCGCALYKEALVRGGKPAEVEDSETSTVKGAQS
jgi:hypothetical protein